MFTGMIAAAVPPPPPPPAGNNPLPPFSRLTLLPWSAGFTAVQVVSEVICGQWKEVVITGKNTQFRPSFALFNNQSLMWICLWCLWLNCRVAKVLWKTLYRERLVIVMAILGRS